MTRLSGNRFVQGPSAPNGTKYVPFTIFARINPDPGFGKRWEKIRSMEELANDVEDLLATIEDTNAASEMFDFADPVKATPQFGDKTARVTIHGNITDSANLTKQTLDPHTVINTGQILSGPGSHNAIKEPAVELDAAVSELKNLVEGVIGLEIYRIELAGFIYGSDGSGRTSSGRSFPL